MRAAVSTVERTAGDSGAMSGSARHVAANWPSAAALPSMMMAMCFGKPFCIQMPVDFGFLAIKTPLVLSVVQSGHGTRLPQGEGGRNDP